MGFYDDFKRMFFHTSSKYKLKWSLKKQTRPKPRPEIDIYVTLLKSVTI